MVKLLLIVSMLAGGYLFGLGKIEREMVYPFDATHVAPAATGLRGIKEVQLRSRGQTIILWVHAADPGQPTVLYFHGNAGNLANRAGRFARLTDRGYGLIAPAYRGSSGSTGRPSERALTRDAVQIWRKLGDLVPGLRPETTVIYGESLGTGVALKLLAQPGTPPPMAVVLEAPYTSLPDVALRAYPQLEPLIGRMKNIWNSKQHAKALTAPLLVMHGTLDQIIPIDQGRQVFDAASSPRKRFLAVRGAGHNDIWRSDSLPVLWRFIDGL